MALSLSVVDYAHMPGSSRYSLSIMSDDADGIPQSIILMAQKVPVNLTLNRGEWTRRRARVRYGEG
jgi:hypothetical protein